MGWGWGEVGWGWDELVEVGLEKGWVGVGLGWGELRVGVMLLDEVLCDAR